MPRALGPAVEAAGAVVVMACGGLAVWVAWGVWCVRYLGEGGYVVRALACGWVGGAVCALAP